MTDLHDVLSRMLRERYAVTPSTGPTLRVAHLTVTTLDSPESTGRPALGRLRDLLLPHVPDAPRRSS
ncbi:hypothetical protein [Deinococcus pimensis]|uniref:hypothetical protein n=1 Tax=Deinococcus pimensis TaxID=309888 RepID=UPI00047F62A3|nr:hypothetical protein [Deinococcus pimensis]